jgi:hypothetical protein
MLMSKRRSTAAPQDLDVSLLARVRSEVCTPMLRQARALSV